MPPFFAAKSNFKGTMVLDGFFDAGESAAGGGGSDQIGDAALESARSQEEE